MSKFMEKVKEEVLLVLPPTLFFFIALHVVALIRSLMSRSEGIPISSSVSIFVAALILGKAVLLADLLPFINRYPQRPLAFNIGWKTLIYLTMSLLIHYAERLIEFARKAGGLLAGNHELLANVSWPKFWAVQILLSVLILSYVTMHELSRAMGEDRFKQLFFGTR